MAANEDGAAIARGEDLQVERTPAADDVLFAKLDTLGPAEGTNIISTWPGLTVHRFCSVTRRRHVEIGSLSIGFVAPSYDSDAAIHGRRVRDRPAYVVTAGGSSLDLEITAASIHRPVLYCALRIEPQLVISTSSKMYPFSVADAPLDPGAMPEPTALDVDLAHAVVGFLGSLSNGCDRRVLAPILLQEVVYRLLRREQRNQLLHLAAHQLRRDPVAAALVHIAEHLADPLSVEALATHVNLSPSAFSRAFREATGRPPYRYIKDRRLERARELLDDRRLGVSAVAGAVGYSSVSHFIKEFSGRFGRTPGEYADIAQQRCRALNPAVQRSSTTRT